MKYHPKTKPFKHQAKATLAAVRQGNHAMLMEPGAGKTKAALDAVGIQYLRGKCSRVVVFTTLSGISVWEDEIERHFPYPQEVEITILNHDKASRRVRQHGSYTYPYLSNVEAKNPDIIILDESHKYKRAGSIRSQAMWRMVQRLRAERGDGQPFVYLLTGTPNPKGYIDLFAQYRIMDPSIFGTSKAQFEDLYCQYGFGRRRFQIVKYRNKETLLSRIRDHATIVSNPIDLPPQRWQNIRVPLPKEAADVYQQLANDLVAEIEDRTIEATNAGTRRLRLLQITGGFVGGEQLHDAKLRAMGDIYTDILESQHPYLVVFCRFIPEVEAITHNLNKLGGHVVAIRGATKARDRSIAVRDFQHGLINCLVFQVETGSLAITLTRARQAVFYSLPDGWDTYYQACKRIHRVGQDHPVLYRHLVCPGTVDIGQLKTLRRKADAHAEMMNNSRKYLFGG